MNTDIINLCGYKKKLLLCFCTLFFSGYVVSQNKQLYPYPMNPTEHPDYLRHYVKAPDMSVFNNKVQFTSLRSIPQDGEDYKKLLDQYTEKDKLGNILWLNWRFLFSNNLKEVVAEIKRRNLYLFDIWGYIPGSGPGGNHQQFLIPDGVLDYFEKELGDHWLGMDNGEQDGRYVGSFAYRMYPLLKDRKQQYFNFQRHFQKLGDCNGNKLSGLVSLTFGHYFLKEGIYTLIGAETAQALPNSQIYYSYLRGAGKQYGVHWFGNASVWNRWGFKSYSKAKSSKDKSNTSSDPTKGTSLSLLKRLMYTHLFYNCAAVGFEGGFYYNDNKSITPVGQIQKEAVKWSEKYSNPGTMYTPVAFMTDFYSGWTFPRHLYSDGSFNPMFSYRVWGNLPYQEGDYLTDNMLNIIYPGYQDASYYRDERGFIAPTPYGDVADCLLSDAPLWLLKQYPLLVIAGKIEPGFEIKYKLEEYVKNGGHLVITSGSLKDMPEGFSGIKVKGTKTMNSSVSFKGNEIKENDLFELSELVLPENAKIIQKCKDLPAIAEVKQEKGIVTIIASPFGLPKHVQCALPIKIRDEKTLDKPYPMLKHVQAYMESLFSNYTLFETDPGLSLVTCVKNEHEYSVLVTNSKWEAVPFAIKSNIGEIESIKEMKINQGEIKALEYTPKSVSKDNIGKNSSNMIVGGGTRAYSIKIKNPQVTIAEKVEATPNQTGLALVVRNTYDLKEEILSRPTFFEHYDRVVIDWRYLENRTNDALSYESGWLNRQKLKIAVDLTSGINLYPDLRIVNNLEESYDESINRIKQVIDKMKLFGADELIISSMRSIENNYTLQQFNKSLVETYKLLADYAKDKEIKLLYRPAWGRVGSQINEAVNITKQVGRSNFMLAPSVALLLNESSKLDESIQLLKDNGVKHLIMSAPQTDINKVMWNTNLPIYKYENQKDIIKILKAFSQCDYIMDGLYESWDDEYMDSKIIKDR